jgi:hypothetical protein
VTAAEQQANANAAAELQAALERAAADLKAAQEALARLTEVSGGQK